MKNQFIYIGVVAVGAGMAIFASHWFQQPQTVGAVPPPVHNHRPAAKAGVQTPSVAKPASLAGPQRGARRDPAPEKQRPPAAVAPAAQPAAITPAMSANQAADCVLSPHSTFQQKQQVWQHLRSSGRLDETIATLEKRMQDTPEAPELPAALGQAYLHKCATLSDVREQGMFGLKADQTFEAALKLDPWSWDARFWKASAMTHWPAQLNKSQEVVEQFATLIEQQETQLPQPHFAESYVQLGDFYQKNGYAEQAREIWQRGARTFPEHGALQKKLAPAVANQK